jgi:hypothetical protein
MDRMNLSLKGFFHIEEIIVEKIQMNRIIHGKFNFGFFYFNPYYSRMQPIIEKSKFYIEIFENKLNNPQL